MKDLLKIECKDIINIVSKEMGIEPENIFDTRKKEYVSSRRICAVLFTILGDKRKTIADNLQLNHPDITHLLRTSGERVQTELDYREHLLNCINELLK